MDEGIEGADVRGEELHVSPDFLCVATLSEHISSIIRDKNEVHYQLEQVKMRLNELRTNGFEPENPGDLSEMNNTLIDLYRRKEDYLREKRKLEDEIKAIQQGIERANQTLQNLEREKEEDARNRETHHQQRLEIEGKLDQLLSETEELDQQLLKLCEKSKNNQYTLREYTVKAKEHQAFLREHSDLAVMRPLDQFHCQFTPHRAEVTSVLFSPHFQNFITTGEDKKAIQWGLPQLNEIATCNLPSVQQYMDVQKEGRYVCMSGFDKIVRILDIQTFRVIADLKTHTDQCTECIWISNSQLLSASKDRTVKLCDINKNSVTSTLMTVSAANSICETNSPTVYCVACQDKSLKLFDLRTMSIERKIPNVHKLYPAISVVFDSATETLWSLGKGQVICQTSVSEGCKIQEKTHPLLDVKNVNTKITLNNDSGFICAGSDNGNVILFNARNNDEPIVLPKSHNAAVLNSAMAANCRITVDAAGNAVFWA